MHIFRYRKDSDDNTLRKLFSQLRSRGITHRYVIHYPYAFFFSVIISKGDLEFIRTAKTKSRHFKPNLLNSPWFTVKTNPPSFITLNI
jgi:hypothetical protein